MFTSYFANPALKKDKRPQVAISRGVPAWFTGISYTPLAPSWEMIRLKDMNEYTRLYNMNILGKLNAQDIVSNFKGCLLLCYEKPGVFCHRRLVAEWIEKNTGVVVPELEFENSLYAQKVLFGD